MNKSEFLSELEKRIRVLDKSEIKDILAEYSQHIDMEISNGQTEEDAIKSFGSIEELTAEILVAYHVNPEYEYDAEISEIIDSDNTEKKNNKKEHFSKAKESLKEWKKKLHDKRLAKKAIKAEQKALKKEKSKDEFGEFIEKGKNNGKAVGRSVGNGVKTLTSKIWTLCKWIFVILCIIPDAALAVISIFGIGIFVVLMFQGYPVIGVLIALIGMAIASVAFGGLLISIVVKKKVVTVESVEYDDIPNDTDDFTGEE